MYFKIKKDKKLQNTSTYKSLLLLMFSLVLSSSYAQQDPQYTHYMYNTMSVNPAYAGQRDVLSIAGLFRTQWVGINGAPDTQTLGIHAPLRNERVGLGLSIVNDNIGPVSELYAAANFSYTIPLNDYYTKLSFGLKGGFHHLKTDWSKGLYEHADPLLNENLSLFSPSIGAGLYLHTENWYLGLSVPNILTTKHYNDIRESVAAERLHYFLIGGYVFDLNESTKLKPAFLVKAVAGAPLIVDLSANMLFNDTMTLGLAWRWDDSVSGLVGFQISKEFFMGYSYDFTTTALRKYNSGTHEIILRYELQKRGRLLSPRFF